MPANNPRQPRRSWKDDKPTGGRAGQGQRGWHKEPAAPGVKGPMLSRRGKIALAASGLVLGIVAIAVWMWWFRNPDPPRFVLIRAGYETNLTVPENVAGIRGLDQIKTWAEDYNTNKAAGRHTIDVKPPFDLRQTREGDDQLDAALKGTTAPTVVIYVAVHGAADSRGPYLIPNDADLKKNDLASYRLDNLLTGIKKLPAKTKKLLILETTSVESDPTMSLLHNDFARALRENEKAIADVPNLAVLVASAEDQRSWISEEWGTSVFAHFVVEGLKGAAADHGVVTAQSLADYVSKQVEQWARDNRSELQTPLLLGDKAMCADFKVALAESSTYQAPDPTTLPPFTAPAGLRAAWKTRDDLEKQDGLEKSQPSPAVYSPLLWRQYLDSLKRYEDLLRANDPTSAATMATRLNELVNRIKDSQRVQGDALANSLAMPKAFGWSLSVADLKRTETDFNALWAAKAAANDYATKLKEWRDNGSDPLQQHLLRLRMTGLLLHKALESEADYTLACNILANAGVNDGVSPYRPAEAHFALMLNRYQLREGRTWAQTKNALEVRLMAEEAALGIDAATPLPAYSEQVLPWIKSETEKFSPDKPSVERADDFRVAGENLRFASAGKAAHVDDATEKARQDYLLLQQKAAIVRQALAARDRAFAELPYYTTWLATLTLSEAEEKQYVDLWEKVHDLGDLLAKPTFDKIDALVKPAKEVDAGMNMVVKKFKAALEVQADIQLSWHEINNLLQVPFIPAGRRMDLLTQLRGISYRLNAQKPSGLTAVDKVQHSQEQMRAAQRRGRLALAALGKDNPAYREAEPAITKPDDGAWGRSLARAGERIAGAYYDTAVKAFADTEKGRQEPLQAARPMLRQAALQARQLSGAAAVAWPSPGPVWESHRVDLHDLLVYQGRRTFADYWTSDDPKLPPYYRDAGNIYRSAAAAMAGGNDANLPPEYKKARLVEVDTLAGLLEADDTLTALYYDGDEAKPGPAVLAVTDEDRVLRRFRLQKAPSAPPGAPVVWTEIGKGLRPAQPQDIEHRALSRDKNEPYELIADHPKDPSVFKEQTTYVFKGFFRGREVKLDTTVNLYHWPEVASYLPESPKTARVAIKSRGDDYDRFAASNSEVAIMIDYSASMNEVTKEAKAKGEKRTRKDEALDALKKCLTQVPRGVRVTALTFSEKGGDGRINTQWGGRPIEWDPTKVTKRMDELALLEPGFDTPLVRATVKAKEAFTPGFTGTKVLLILTDGGDNYYKKGKYKDLNIRKNGDQQESMTSYLGREFKDTGILVNVIGIETDFLDPKDDKDEYEGLQDYKPAIQALGGNFVAVKDSKNLAREIERALSQIHFRLDGESGVVPPGKEEGDISRDQQNYQWINGLKPGTFMVNVLTKRLSDRKNEKKAIEQRVRLQGGDSLVLTLEPVPDSKEFQFRREMWANSHTTSIFNKLIAQKEPLDTSWLVSVLQNQRMDWGRNLHRLQIMTAIEKRDSATVTAITPLQVVRPKFVWFNVSAKDAPGKLPPGGLRFYPLADYPAPAYSIDLREWSQGKESVLNVWWTEDTPPDCGILRPKAGKRLIDLKPQELEVRPTGQADLVVESIAYERRTVELKPNEKPKPDVDCVVVRLRWDPDPGKVKAFFAMLPDDLEATGAEHKFYLEAGKYTGVFFNVSKEKLQSLDRLTLYSVDGVKAKAKEHMVNDLTMGVPNGNGRPQKPED